MKSSLILIICYLFHVSRAQSWYLKGNPHFLTYQNYDQIIKKDTQNIKVIKFFTPWCRYCRLLKNYFDQSKIQNNDTKFYQVNCDQNRKICDYYDIRSFPSVIFLWDNNKYAHEIEGYYEPVEYKQMISQVIDQMKNTIQKQKERNRKLAKKEENENNQNQKQEQEIEKTEGKSLDIAQNENNQHEQQKQQSQKNTNNKEKSQNGYENQNNNKKQSITQNVHSENINQNQFIIDHKQVNKQQEVPASSKILYRPNLKKNQQIQSSNIDKYLNQVIDQQRQTNQVIVLQISVDSIQKYIIYLMIIAIGLLYFIKILPKNPQPQSPSNQNQSKTLIIQCKINDKVQQKSLLSSQNIDSVSTIQ